MRFIGVMVALLVSGLAWAESDGAGTIKTLNGSVEIQRDSATLGAEPGMRVQQSDVIKTGPKSAVGITLRDNTLLSAGENSVLSLDQFVFDSRTQKGALQVTLRKGTLSSISGALAKNSPEAVQFKTSTMTLGVRGTEFIIEATE